MGGLDREVVDAEGHVEGRVAQRCTVGFKEDWCAAADEDVLRADVTKHKGRGGGVDRVGKVQQAGREVGMMGGGGAQVGIGADGAEIGGIVGGGAVKAGGGTAGVDLRDGDGDGDGDGGSFRAR
ncbi:MAG: hypothetical protein Q8M59_17400 [Tabrizicola sp.]|nr:hypothetical protein [Tabrizicola sp.]MDP3264729.1 hypothetical protein [Tabrizicola sp.]MDP3649924.1 hypothetical protein [Paracoccaceae bacterium]